MRGLVWLCWHNDTVVKVCSEEEKAKKWMRVFIQDAAIDHVGIRHRSDHYATSDTLAYARIEIQPRTIE